MIEFVKKLFSKKKMSPFYVKLTSALKRDGKNLEIVKAFYLGGERYSESGFNALLESLKNDVNLEKLHALKYDNLSDNIEVYLVENNEGKVFLILLYDPYEIYQAEEVLKIFPIQEKKLRDMKKADQIYPC